MSDMGDTLPDDPAFYTSPHSEAVLIAIGRFITAWAAIEGALPMHVARLIATNDPSNPKAFAHTQYLRATAALMGTAASAALTQLQNLAPARKDEIKKAGDAILGIKPKRDAVAHSVSGPTDSGDTQFHGFGASRVKMGTDKFYSVEQIDGWCDSLKKHAREIDSIVSDITGWRWKDIAADQERWLASLPKTASETPGNPLH